MLKTSKSSMSSELRARPRYLLAIDPGENTGWAFFIEGQLTKYGKARGANWYTFMEDMVLPSLDIYTGTNLAVIEQGWLNRSKGAITLSQRRGIAQAAAEASGFRAIKYIASATWQNGLYGPIHGKNTKELAFDFVKKTCNITEEISHDVAEAIAIGHYALGIRNG